MCRRRCVVGFVKGLGCRMLRSVEDSSRLLCRESKLSSMPFPDGRRARVVRGELKITNRVDGSASIRNMGEAVQPHPAGFARFVRRRALTAFARDGVLD